MILLAIVHPRQIAAIPKGLRAQKTLFLKDPMPEIKEDVDRFTCEKLYMSPPDIAFVSTHYSHPATLKAFQSQGIRLCDSGSQDSFEAIKTTIQSIGREIERNEEAQLMTLFMDAALMAIDNRLTALGSFPTPQRFLYLTYPSHFALPSSKTFTVQFLQRLGFPEVKTPLSASQYISFEQLRCEDPDCLVISTRFVESLKEKIFQDPLLQELKAVRNGKVFFVDDDIQQSPSQFCVLAYYDLAQTLAEGTLP